MTVFEYENYKDFLNFRLNPHGKSRGLRTKMAEKLNCQIGFISQVLNGNTHFSLEHAALISEFLDLNQEENDYFLLLVQLGRAGSHLLQLQFKRQISNIKKARQEVKSRIKTDVNLSPLDYGIYYSSWMYVALHMALSIEEYQSKEAIRKKLNLTISQFDEVTSFLISKGLIIEEKGKYKTGTTRIHLKRESPLISQHHVNWRLEAMKSIPKRTEHDMHFSSVMTMSKKDFEKIKDILLTSLGKIEEVLIPSPNEEIYTLNLDFFKLEY